MGLTNKQYQTIMQEYQDLNNQHRDTIEKKENELRTVCPEYFEICRELNAVRLQRTKASLMQDEPSINSCLSKEKELKEKRNATLSSHGYPVNYLSINYRCDTCQDTGFLPGTKQKCKCFIKAQTRLLFDQSGIMDLLKDQNFDTLSYDYFDETEAAEYANAVSIANNFITNFNSDYQNLLFYGNVGTGKTFLTCCVAKALMEQGISVTYCSAEKLFRNLVDLRFQDDKDEYFSYMEDIFERDLLIIDDLGTEHITDRVKSDLFTCLNNRDIAHKATIISTNLSLEELNNRYSERIFSRISSHFTFCKFNGRDIRFIKKFRDKATS